MSDAFEDEGAGRRGLLGWPLLIALLGCLALILAAAILPKILPPRGVSSLVLIGSGAGLALWLLVLAVGGRSRQWIPVMLALLLLPGTGALAGLGAGRIYAARASIDAQTFAELDVGADGTPGAPSAAAGRGPVSAAYLAALREAEQDQRDFTAALGASGLGTLNSPYVLQQAPQVLRDCAAIGGLERVAQAHRDRARTRAAQLADAVDRSELPAGVKPGARLIVTAGGEDAILASRIELIRASRAQCDLLARRTWHNAGGLFGFANAGDRAAFGALAARRMAAAGKAEQLQRAAKDQRLAGREQVREALMR